MHIAILDFRDYRVKLYSGIELDITDIEAVENWLVEQGFNLDEIQYMTGEESMEVDVSDWNYQIN